jgi:hypothetical protein
MFFDSFQADEGTVENIIYEKKLKNKPENLLGDGEAIAKRLLKDKKTLYYGSLTDLMSFDPQENLREYKIMEGKNKPLTIVLQKDSEFTDLLNYHMLKIVEYGQLQILFRHWVPNLFKPPITEPLVSDPISLIGAFFPFLVLNVMILLSFILALFEFIQFRIIKRKL